MDYTKASDFEINKAVAIKQGLLVQELDDTRSIGMTSDFHEKYPSTIWGAKADERGMQCEPWEQLNYCNSWADMGTIIVENEISLIKDVSTDDVWLAIPKGWFSTGGFESSMGNELSCVNTNPLRAAAIVYLMMGN